MSRRKFFGTIQDKSGNVVQGASVLVEIAGTSTVAVLYADDGQTIIANPTTTDARGEYSFRVAPGQYDITATFSGSTSKKSGVVIDPVATSAGRALVEAVDVNAQRTALGLDAAQFTEYPLHASGPRLAIFYNNLTQVNFLNDDGALIAITDDNDIASYFAERFDALVLVDGATTPTNTYYSDNLSVINKIKSIRPEFVIIQYLHLGETIAPYNLSQLQDQVFNAIVSGVDGFFLDECEYGFETPRSKINNIMQAIHNSENTASGRRPFAMVNCWDQSELIAGSTHPTLNPSGVGVSFHAGDALFHESLVHHPEYVGGTNGYASYMNTADQWAKETPSLTLRRTFGLHYYVSNLMPRDGGGAGLTITRDQQLAIWRDCESLAKLYGCDAHVLTCEGYSGANAQGNLPYLAPSFPVDPSFQRWKSKKPIIEVVTNWGSDHEVRRGGMMYRGRGNSDTDCQHTIYDPDVHARCIPILADSVRFPCPRGRKARINARLVTAAIGSSISVYAVAVTASGTVVASGVVTWHKGGTTGGASPFSMSGTSGNSLLGSTSGTNPVIADINLTALVSDYASDLFLYLTRDSAGGTVLALDKDKCSAEVSFSP